MVDKINQQLAKSIEIDGCKIQFQPSPHTNKSAWRISYSEISNKFWDDIYQAFDKQFTGTKKLNEFLLEWDDWYEELVDLYKYFSHKERMLEREGATVASFSTPNYPSPWSGGIGEEFNKDIRKFGIEDRWKFIQTIKPPTRSSSDPKRTIKRDLKNRERRSGCVYANAYSILLLKKTYYDWIDENVENVLPINIGCTSTSSQGIVEAVNEIEYTEFVFCGAIPYILLNEKYLQKLRINLSGSTPEKPQLYTFLLLYPNTENLLALSKLRRVSPTNILFDVLHTHNVLLDELLWTRHEHKYIRVLYVDSLPSHDVYLLDKDVCLMSLDLGRFDENDEVIDIPFCDEDDDVESKMVLFLNEENSKLVERVRRQVNSLWISTLKEHCLDRFICKSSSSRTLYDDLVRKASKQLYVNDPKLPVMDYMGFFADKISDLNYWSNYIPPQEHIFRSNYSILFDLSKDRAAHRQSTLKSIPSICEEYEKPILRELSNLYSENGDKAHLN